MQFGGSSPILTFCCFDSQPFHFSLASSPIWPFPLCNLVLLAQNCQQQRAWSSPELQSHPANFPMISSDWRSWFTFLCVNKPTQIHPVKKRHQLDQSWQNKRSILISSPFHQEHWAAIIKKFCCWTDINHCSLSFFAGSRQAGRDFQQLINMKPV